MNKLVIYMKREADVEFFACAHIVSYLFIYSLLGWLAGDGSISFRMLMIYAILGYAVSWTQKGLFLSDKSYEKKSRRIRAVLWNVLPIAETLLTDWLFHPFKGYPFWVQGWFTGFMCIYFIMVWFFIQKVYKSDTIEMNELLQKYKEKDSKESI